MGTGRFSGKSIGGWGRTLSVRGRRAFCSRLHNETGPQGGMRYEHPPPNPAYVGQWNYASVFVPFPPVVWDESEDLGRDPVDRGERILQGPNQAEDFETILFEIVDLNTRRVSHTQTPVLLVCFTSAISRVVAILARSKFRPATQRISPLRTYSILKAVSRGTFMVARRCWNIEDPRLVVGVGMIGEADLGDHGDRRSVRNVTCKLTWPELIPAKFQVNLSPLSIF